jgi:hypothetical protein
MVDFSGDNSDSESAMMTSIYPGRSLDQQLLKTATSVKDGVYSHESLDTHFLVEKTVMNLYLESSEVLITQRR